MSPALAILLLLDIGALPPLDAAVLPVGGNAAAKERARATQILVDALAGMDGLHVISLAKLGELLGKDVGAELLGCTDDACYVRTTKQIRSDVLVVGSLDMETGRTTLRLRLVPTSSVSPAAARVRVSREVAHPESAADMLSAVTSGAIELFPEYADRSFGTLVLAGGVPGATLFIDGQARIPTDRQAVDGQLVRLRAGRHAILVTAPGHRPLALDAEILVGQRTTLAIDLAKNRSRSPLILGGAGVLAAGAGLVFGQLARGIARDWEGACTSRRCAPGFTRARYDEDASSIDRDRISANGLFIASGVALVAAALWYIFDPGTDTDVEERTP